MKVIVESESKHRVIPFKEISPGTCYKLECGAILIKLLDNECVVISDVYDDAWWSIGKAGQGNFKGLPAVSILGVVKKLIVT